VYCHDVTMLHALTQLSWILGTFAVMLGTAAGAIGAETPEHDIGPGDAAISESRSGSVWIVSTRHLGSTQCEAEFRRDVELLRRDENGCWQEATLAEFRAAGETATTTLFYVHGNRFEWHDAIEYGAYTRDALSLEDNDAAGVRFVIWSWPSDKIHGALRDVRLKAYRTHCEAYYLACFLSGMDPEAHVGLIGFSYGARIISGALHLVAGGALCDLHLQDLPAVKPARVVLVAAGLHNYWLLPGNFHGQALDQTDEMLILYNSQDIVLKRYHLLEKGSRPRALGYTGLCTGQGYAAVADRVTQVDSRWYVGRSHREMSYFCSPALMELARRFLLWQQVD
jgi:hypothetical protein